MGCHLSKPTASHEADEVDAPSGQDAGHGNSAPLEQSRGASAAASMVLSEVQPPTIVRGAPLQDPLAGSLALSEEQPATIFGGAPLQNPLAGDGAQLVDHRAVVADDGLDISVCSAFADVAPQEVCGAACLPRQLPTFAPIVSPHDSVEPGAGSAPVTLNPKSALHLPCASGQTPKAVRFADDAMSPGSRRRSSGPRRRPPHKGSLPATPLQGSLLPGMPQQVPRGLVLRKAVTLHVDSSAEVNRAVHAKFKGNLLPAER
jgi:hypothetical protein